MRSSGWFVLALCIVTGAPHGAPPLGAWQVSPAQSLELLPDGLLYPLYRGGWKEPRVSGVLLAGADGATYLDAALGGRLGILRYAGNPSAGRWSWQLDVEASVHPRLNLGHIRRAMESADFRYAVPITARQGPLALKFGYAHLSSHVGDEFLERNLAFVRVNYVRESAFLGVTYEPLADWMTYAEAGYAVYVSGGAEPWEIQLGSEYSLPIERCGCGRPFVAIHGHLREEADFGGSLATTAGWEWRGADGDRYLRVALEYRRGKSSQLEFFDREERLFGIGVQVGP